MKNIVLLVGPPGSGKSSLSKSYIGYTRISQDDQGKEGHLKLFKEALERQDDIVVDRMNFSKQQRERYLKPAKELGYTTSIHNIIVPLSVCFSRMKCRLNHPTITSSKHAINALNTFFSKYEYITEDEADNVLTEKYSEKVKPDAIYCDIDGTIANIDQRLHHVHGEGKKNWKGFFDDMINDLVYEDIVDILRTYKEKGTKIVLCSGRPDDYRTLTTTWLQNNNIPFDELVMRSRGDFRRDDLVKSILLDYEILPKYNIKFALDDRDQVVKMLRNKNIRTLQVNYGDF